MLKEYSAEVRNAGNHQDSSAKTPAVVPPVSKHQGEKKTSGPQYKVSPPVKPLPRVDTKQPEGQKSQPAVPPNPSISQHSAGGNSLNIVGDGNEIHLNLNPNDVASFHVTGTQVAFNSRNPNQLIANTYIHNDAGEVNILVYALGRMAKASADEQPVINELREIVSGDVKQGGGRHFTVRKNEARWFTVESPVLSDDEIQQYKKGELAFYFVASVVIAEHNTTNVLEHCGFVIGDRPRVILDCPYSVKKH